MFSLPLDGGGRAGPPSGRHGVFEGTFPTPPPWETKGSSAPSPQAAAGSSSSCRPVQTGVRPGAITPSSSCSGNISGTCSGQVPDPTQLGAGRKNSETLKGSISQASKRPDPATREGREPEVCPEFTPTQRNSVRPILKILSNTF